MSTTPVQTLNQRPALVTGAVGPQTSTASTVVVAGAEIDATQCLTVCYTAVAATNDIDWSVWGANAADYSDEVAVLAATKISAGSNASYTASPAPCESAAEQEPPLSLLPAGRAAHGVGESALPWRGRTTRHSQHHTRNTEMSKRRGARRPPAMKRTCATATTSEAAVCKALARVGLVLQCNVVTCSRKTATLHWLFRDADTNRVMLQYWPGNGTVLDGDMNKGKVADAWEAAKLAARSAGRVLGVDLALPR